MMPMTTCLAETVYLRALLFAQQVLQFSMAGPIPLAVGPGAHTINQGSHADLLSSW